MDFKIYNIDPQNYNTFTYFNWVNNPRNVKFSRSYENQSHPFHDFNIIFSLGTLAYTNPKSLNLFDPKNTSTFIDIQMLGKKFITFANLTELPTYSQLNLLCLYCFFLMNHIFETYNKTEPLMCVFHLSIVLNSFEQLTLKDQIKNTNKRKLTNFLREHFCFLLSILPIKNDILENSYKKKKNDKNCQKSNIIVLYASWKCLNTNYYVTFLETIFYSSLMSFQGIKNIL